MAISITAFPVHVYYVSHYLVMQL